MLVATPQALRQCEISTCIEESSSHLRMCERAGSKSHVLPTLLQQHWRGEGAYSFVPVETFADAYKASPAGRASQAALEAPPLQLPSHLDPLVRTRYGIGSWAMFKALLRRELTIMVRNRFLYIFKILQVGGGIMSVF